MNRVVNILLVEDDKLDQVEVSRVLNKKGILHKLKIASNGEDALAKLNEDESDVFTGKPHIMLVDLNMPKMNGMELLSKMKERGDMREIKVFMLTTSEEKEDKQAAKSFGVSGFITKPLKLDSPSSMDAFNLMIDLMNMRVQ